MIFKSGEEESRMGVGWGSNTRQPLPSQNEARQGAKMKNVTERENTKHGS